MNNELYHYGVLGMKWGVRRYQNSDGSLTDEGKRRYGNIKNFRRDANGDYILNKDSKVKRVALQKEDPIFDNKKYVSLTDSDHNKWDDRLGNAYLNRGQATYSITYKTNKDIKIASSTKQGKIYLDMLMKDKNFAKQAAEDIKVVNRKFNVKKSKSNSENISRNIALQTETGKKFVNKLMSMGYEGLVDTHGKNVADIPIILLNPDKNLTKESTELTNAVRNYYRQYGFA